MTAKNVGLTSTNAELRGFIDQNLSPTKGNISFVAFPVSSTNSPTKILPKTLGPINVNVGPQMMGLLSPFIKYLLCVFSEHLLALC
uniref:Transcription factor Dp-2 n=1 Tax=Ursus maritimus TaxID=29073 RepID=A0A452UD76_URSMA